jgi:hypothetical protein
MKTSNKTNGRFLGIAVIVMVLSLVTLNLSAQKPQYEELYANIEHFIFANTEAAMFREIFDGTNKFKEESVESWMIHKSSYKEENTDARKHESKTNSSINRNSENNSTPSTGSNCINKLMVPEKRINNTIWSNNGDEVDMQIESWMISASEWEILN